MRNHKLIASLILCFVFFGSVSAQDVFGKWKTVDDVTGVTKSVVEVYEENGKTYGKILTVLDPTAPENAICDACPGSDNGKPIEGLVFIKGLSKDGEEYNGGKILDPESGKLYKCYLELAAPNKLKVRGYIGFALLGRTQYWYRTE